MDIEFRNDLISEVDAPLFVAVSGGADSIAVAHFLSCQGQSPDRIRILHFNHKIRKENDYMQESVEDFADYYNIDVVVGEPKSDNQIDGPKASCREARYEFFVSYLEKLKEFRSQPLNLIMAHHLDDCVESYLMKACRGTVCDNRPIIPPMRLLSYVGGNNIWLHRPFLLTPKDVLREYVTHYELWDFVCPDKTNKDASYCTRNFLRHKVIPTIEKRYPGLKTVVRKMVNKSFSRAPSYS